MLQPFEVDVAYTDRTRLPDGSYFQVVRRVDVLAVDHVEATLIAAQLVATVRDHIGGMVLSTTIVL